uniref:Uncharacterized protein n=1 Tax=Rhizophora mucronata TaxID=61149 RepID=A0A2P2IID7_RHIMU
MYKYKNKKNVPDRKNLDYIKTSNITHSFLQRKIKYAKQSQKRSWQKNKNSKQAAIASR